MRRATAAAGVVRKFMEYAVRHGADEAALLAAGDVRLETLRDQDARLPLDAYRRMMLTAIEAVDDPTLPMRYCIDTRIEEISIVGLIIHAATSMPDSMVQLNRYGKLMVEVDVMPGQERFSVVPEGDRVWIIDNRPDPNSFVQLTETAMATFIGEFRRHFPDRPFARAIEVTHSRPAYAEACEALLRAPITYEAGRNALEIDPVWLTQEFDGDTSYVFGLFAEKADALLAELEADGSARARIESLLLPLLHKGEVTAEQIATEMGMSRQTMYRRLKEENTTFAEIIDDLRHRMAADYLTTRRATVNEVAYLVGFSEASSFTRAFRRWTGTTPADFRARAA